MSFEHLAKALIQNAPFKVGPNTILARDGDDIVIRLYATNVVTFHEDGTCSLNSGGHMTTSTKDCINQFCPSASITSERGKWLVVPREGIGHRFPFVDGMRLNKKGHPLTASIALEDKVNDKMQQLASALTNRRSK